MTSEPTSLITTEDASVTYITDCPIYTECNFPGRQFVGSFKILNQAWDDRYSDDTDCLYRRVAHSLYTLVDTSLKSSPLSSIYTCNAITGFRQGSVIANNTVTLDKDANITASEFEDIYVKAINGSSEFEILLSSVEFSELQAETTVDYITYFDSTMESVATTEIATDLNTVQESTVADLTITTSVGITTDTPTSEAETSTFVQISTQETFEPTDQTVSDVRTITTVGMTTQETDFASSLLVSGTETLETTELQTTGIETDHTTDQLTGITTDTPTSEAESSTFVQISTQETFEPTDQTMSDVLTITTVAMTTQETDFPSSPLVSGTEILETTEMQTTGIVTDHTTDLLTVTTFETTEQSRSSEATITTVTQETDYLSSTLDSSTGLTQTSEYVTTIERVASTDLPTATFSTESFSTSSEGTTILKVTTDCEPYTPTKGFGRIFRYEVKMNNQAWNNDLLNTESCVFYKKAILLNEEVNLLFSSSTIRNSYVSNAVTGFRKGSLVTEGTIDLNATSPYNETDVEDVFLDDTGFFNESEILSVQEILESTTDDYITYFDSTPLTDTSRAVSTGHTELESTAVTTKETVFPTSPDTDATMVTGYTSEIPTSEVASTTLPTVTSQETFETTEQSRSSEASITTIETVTQETDYLSSTLDSGTGITQTSEYATSTIETVASTDLPTAPFST
uniref:Location of vulva defective 1-like n=1 Tax=Saccoglossus kowalevskii TaxID=10224 RepID=A0ABM0LZU2_SACKO